MTTSTLGCYFRLDDLTRFCFSQNPKINHWALDVHPHLAIKKALSYGRMCIWVTGIKDSQLCFSSGGFARCLTSYYFEAQIYIFIILSLHFFSFDLSPKQLDPWSSCCVRAFCTHPGHWPNTKIGEVIFRLHTEFAYIHSKPFKMIHGWQCHLELLVCFDASRRIQLVYTQRTNNFFVKSTFLAHFYEVMNPNETKC